MATKHVRLEDEQHEALAKIKDKDGVPIAESVRRAISEYLKRRKKDKGYEKGTKQER